MTLTEFLQTVAQTYDRTAAMSSPAQSLLRHGEWHLNGHVPGGIVIRGSGGKGTPTHTPWVGFFDPDETDTPESGIYAVYLFSANLAVLTLSVMQGITELTRELGAARARTRLAHDATAIRAAMGSLGRWDTNMALASAGFRQLAYEAGNIAALSYDTANLPAESRLRADLSEGLRIYERAVQAKRYLLQARPGEIGSSSVIQQRGRAGEDPLMGFKPKSAEDYVAHLTGRALMKSRRHERLVNEYCAWVVNGGYRASSEHPVDLLLRRDGVTWLVEGKVLYGGNATHAVRAALGQLYAYRHFLYPSESELRLLALFAEPVGGGFVSFLEQSGIASVWKASNAWAGTIAAREAGLTGPLRALD